MLHSSVFSIRGATVCNLQHKVAIFSLSSVHLVDCFSVMLLVMMFHTSLGITLVDPCHFVRVP